jgi:hypothetical protein
MERRMGEKVPYFRQNASSRSSFYDPSNIGGIDFEFLYFSPHKTK